jgi:hypothetical protein
MYIVYDKYEWWIGRDAEWSSGSFRCRNFVLIWGTDKNHVLCRRPRWESERRIRKKKLLTRGPTRFIDVLEIYDRCSLVGRPACIPPWPCWGKVGWIGPKNELLLFVIYCNFGTQWCSLTLELHIHTIKIVLIIQFLVKPLEMLPLNCQILLHSVGRVGPPSVMNQVTSLTVLLIKYLNRASGTKPAKWNTLSHNLFQFVSAHLLQINVFSLCAPTHLPWYSSFVFPGHYTQSLNFTAVHSQCLTWQRCRNHRPPFSSRSYP